MSSDESSNIYFEIHVSDLSLTSNIFTTNILSNPIVTPTALDPQVGDQGKRSVNNLIN